MRFTMRRALAVSLSLSVVIAGSLASVLAGCGGSSCEAGTLTATLTYDAVARTADTLRVRSTINGASISADVPYTGQTTVRVPFPDVAYSAGLVVDVVVEARLAGALISSAAQTGYVLPSSCGVVAVSFDETATRFSISGMVTGLAGTGLVVTDGVDSLPVAASGPITFPTSVATGASYDVIVTTEPSAPAQTCMVTNGTGYVDDVNITNIVVACAVGAYKIGGTIHGLDSPGLEIDLNDGQSVMPLSSSGADVTYVFPHAVPSGTAYTVTITTPPSIQTCVFDSNSGTSVGGTIGDANATNLDITCNNT